MEEDEGVGLRVVADAEADEEDDDDDELSCVSVICCCCKRAAAALAAHAFLLATSVVRLLYLGMILVGVGVGVGVKGVEFPPSRKSTPSSPPRPFAS